MKIKMFYSTNTIIIIRNIKNVRFRLQSFQRKYDVLAVLIIFDSRGTQDSGPGYRHPKKELEVGDDFSLVVCCPSVSMLKHF